MSYRRVHDMPLDAKIQGISSSDDKEFWGSDALGYVSFSG